MTSHRPESEALGPQARRAFDTILERLSRLDDELRVLQGTHEWGAGFVAFASLDGNASDPTIVHRFERAYAGAWETLDDFVTDTIEALGWREDLTALKRRHAIDDDYLNWDYAAIKSRLHLEYEFAALDGITHAFHR